MRVLVVGSTGFIGAAVASRLRGCGHDVVGLSRRTLDIAKATTPDAWRLHLRGIDAVIYCAGLLQESAQELLGAVHADGPRALFEACRQAAVRRVIHLSALGV